MSPIRQKLLMMTVAAAVGLLLVEAGVRTLGFTIPQGNSWAPHEKLGWTDSPDRRHVHQVEGRLVTVETNHLGFRDGEHSRAKPPGTRRIAIIGDSFVAATQVNLSETFPKLLQARLNDETSPGAWEVLSFGVGDWGNAQQLIALQEIVLSHQPDLVLWQLFPLNDICNNERALAFNCKSLNDAYRPYLGANGEMNYLYPWRQRLREYWLSFAYLDRWQLMMRHYRFGLKLKEREIIPGPRGPVSALLATYLPHELQPDPVQQAWRTTEILLKRFIEVSREAEIPLGAIMVPFVARLGTTWERYARASDTAGMERDYADRRLVRGFAAEDVPALALRGCFERHLDRVLPYVDGHLSASGHAVAAECIWDFLQSSGLLPTAGYPDSKATLFG